MNNSITCKVDPIADKPIWEKNADCSNPGMILSSTDHFVLTCTVLLMPAKYIQVFFVWVKTQSLSAVVKCETFCYRLFLQHLVCCMRDCHCRFSRNGPQMRRTWYNSITLHLHYRSTMKLMIMVINILDNIQQCKLPFTRWLHFNNIYHLSLQSRVYLTGYNPCDKISVVIYSLRFFETQYIAGCNSWLLCRWNCGSQGVVWTEENWTGQEKCCKSWNAHHITGWHQIHITLK